MTISIAYFAEKLLTQLPVAALIYSEEKRIVWISEQLSQWLAVEPNNLVGQHIGELAIEKRKEKPGYFYIGGNAKALSMHVVQLDQVGKMFACYFKDKPFTQKNNGFKGVAANPALDQAMSFEPPVRPQVDQFLEYEISRCRRYHNPLSVLKIKFRIYPNVDLTEWQRVSQSIFYFLSERTRWVDMIKSQADDNFVLVFPETSPANLPDIVSKINQGLTRMFKVQYPHLTMDFSYGSASWEHGDTGRSLLDKASLELTQKQAGGS